MADLIKENNQKVDPLQGLNPNQNKPVEDIQNGDPKAGASRDQRSGAQEARGANPSLDTAEMGGKEGEVPPHTSPATSTTGEPLKADAYMQAGTSPLWHDKPLKDLIEGDGAAARARGDDEEDEG